MKAKRGRPRKRGLGSGNGAEPIKPEVLTAQVVAAVTAAVAGDQEQIRSKALVLRNNPQVLEAAERAIALVPRFVKDEVGTEWREKMRKWLNSAEVVEYVQKLALTPGGKRILQKLIDKAFASPQHAKYRDNQRPLRLILGVKAGDGATINLGYAPMQVDVQDADDDPGGDA